MLNEIPYKFYCMPFSKSRIHIVHISNILKDKCFFFSNDKNHTIGYNTKSIPYKKEQPTPAGSVRTLFRIYSRINRGRFLKRIKKISCNGCNTLYCLFSRAKNRCLVTALYKMPAKPKLKYFCIVFCI